MFQFELQLHVRKFNMNAFIIHARFIKWISTSQRSYQVNEENQKANAKQNGKPGSAPYWSGGRNIKTPEICQKDVESIVFSKTNILHFTLTTWKIFRPAHVFCIYYRHDPFQWACLDSVMVFCCLLIN